MVMRDTGHARILNAIKQALADAGLSREILIDERRRTLAIDAYNARLGGVDERLAGKHLTPMASAGAVAIPRDLRKADVHAFLETAQSGGLVYVLFAGGRATRMQLPAAFDTLGIAGLTPAILRALQTSDSAVPGDLRDAQEPLQAAVRADVSSLANLSLLQRYVLQWRRQLQALVASCGLPADTADRVLARLQLVVIANSSNLETLARQLGAVDCAGLDPAHIYLLEQGEYGGLAVTESGDVQWTDREAWPLGHGEPVLAMNRRDASVFRLDGTGRLAPLETTLGEALLAGGCRYATVAQVNDLHLLSDPLSVERVMTALGLMKTRGAAMVAEVVDNRALQQKGGAIFERHDGFVEMRDTIALRTPALEALSVPVSLSRMFYVVQLHDLLRLPDASLPAYLNARRTRLGETVLSVECLSGDMTSTLPALAIQQADFPLNTFKNRERIGAALDAIAEQDRGRSFLSEIR